MDSYGLRDLFRTEVDDNVAPYLWSDDQIAAYMNDAQKMFCRLTNGIADSTSEVCTIDITAGDATASIDSRILKVRRAQRDSDAEKLTVYNVEDLDERGIRLTSLQGPVRALVLGTEDHTVRWLDVPLVDDTVSLMVYRLPLREIGTTRAQLEIDSQHHFHLILWMKHLAYSRQDADTFNQKLADQNEAAFRRYCAQAKAEQDRARSKIRTVAYGGI